MLPEHAVLVSKPEANPGMRDADCSNQHIYFTIIYLEESTVLVQVFAVSKTKVGRFPSTFFVH
jgi:hypothetical protein